MYKIIMPDGTKQITDELIYIRLHSNGCYVPCQRKDSEGIAHNGIPYMYADGIVVCEFDGGAAVDALNQQLAEVDEAAIELYESSIALEEIVVEQDEAIIEIYEMMEEFING